MNTLERHPQWDAVKSVCQRLKTAGFEALLAGGCVRDHLMHREPNDFDVATNATPDEVEELFERSVAVGKAFGVIVLPFDGFNIEVATFREDLEYIDGRRPEGVKFSTAKADAQRRDFTVNALFYDLEKKEVIDYVDGQADIARRVLRTVGRANDRFDEDKLRILRAIRFSAQLNFDIEPETLKAITERAGDVSVVSQERIRDEIQKLLKSRHRTRGLELLHSTGVLAGVFPALSEAMADQESVWLRAFEALEDDREHGDDLHDEGDHIDDPTGLLALFLWPAYRAPASLLKSLKLENSQSDSIANIFKNLETILNPSTISKGELAYLLTKPFAPSLLLVADTLARADALSHELYDREIWNEALARARPDGVTPIECLVTGKDLIAMGFKPGPKMGETLHAVFLAQLDGTLNSRAEIEAWIRARS